MKSCKREAIIFQTWLIREVLPSINKYGSYSIDKYQGSFLPEEDLYEYMNTNVCYIAFIGVYNNEPLYKIGISYDYYRREYQEHRKIFDQFNLIFLRRTDNNRTIENIFKKECMMSDIYREREFKGKNRTELFTTTEKYTIQRIMNLMNKLIDENPTKEIK
jgi:hypothetical protein